jgi:hypothetical protein
MRWLIPPIIDSGESFTHKNFDWFQTPSFIQFKSVSFDDRWIPDWTEIIRAESVEESVEESIEESVEYCHCVAQSVVNESSKLLLKI